MRRTLNDMAHETREKILEAALESLKRNGFAGTSTRAIGTLGGFNAALIHYYFGSLHGLLVAALAHASEERLIRQRPEIEAVESLAELIAILDRLYREDRDSGFIRVVSEMVAGSVAYPELGPQVVELMGPWIDLAETAAERVFAGVPMAGIVSPRELAVGAVTFYLGANLMTQLVPDSPEIERLLESAKRVSALLQPPG